jgi:hypothetical protein
MRAALGQVVIARLDRAISLDTERCPVEPGVT